MSSRAYWDHEFSTRAAAHQEQNRQISEDFFRKIVGKASFSIAIHAARTVLEVGCGTGELLDVFSRHNPLAELHGTDLSASAVETATARFGRHNIRFSVEDGTTDGESRRYDLSIASNVLEHFKEPFVLLDKMLAVSDRAIVLVPYAQPCTDGYDAEGGAGHVFTFTESSFLQYDVIDWFLFETPGWQHSARGEKPRQMAVLLRKAP